MDSLPEKLRKKSRLLVWAAVAFALAIPLLAGFQTYYLYVAAQCVVFAVVALSLDLLIGRSGQISLGQGGFVAIGAYGTALMAGRLGFDVLAATALSAIVAALVGLVLAFPASRLRGHYLGIVTLGFAVAVGQIALKWTSLTNGDEGIHLHPRTLFVLDLQKPLVMYYTALAILILVIAFVHAIEQSKLGRAFEAVRDGEIAAAAMGVPVARTKVIAFVLSTGIAGIAGGLFAALNGFVAPEDFGIGQTLSFFAMVIVGGMGSIPGAIAGAVVITLVSQIASTVSGLSLVLVGATIIAIALFFPGGIKSIVARLVQTVKT